MKCESSPEVWELHTLLYSTLYVAVTSIKKNERKLIWEKGRGLSIILREGGTIWCIYNY